MEAASGLGWGGRPAHTPIAGNELPVLLGLLLDVVSSSLDRHGCTSTSICSLGWGQGWGGSLPLLISSGASGVLSQQPLCTILLQGKSLYLPPGAQLPLPHPKLPASRSRAHSSASICFFLVWVKIRLSPLSCSCTCLEWFVHIPALSLLPKSLSFSRQCGFIYVIILNLLSNLGRQE